MKLQLNRTTRAPRYTEGKLLIDNALFCDTIEPTERTLRSISDKVNGHTAIPAGTYVVEYCYNNKFGCKMPRLRDVPMFDGILIHPGNTVHDSRGCILVGIKDSDGHLSASRLTFNRLLSRILNAEGKITITIE